ncbi:MAG: sulfurase [Chloroflexi bacterium]|nr:sulfurase [Chloroflexota bacterium]
MEGIIVSLHIAPKAHAPMRVLPTAHLVPGRGIEGDRFYAMHETQNSGGRETCDVTLVEEEAIEALRKAKPDIDPGASARRNIVVRGCALRQLVGHTFRIGGVTLCGLVPHADSCDSSERSQQTACAAVQPGELRAQILTEGIIRVGDCLEAN